MKISIKRFIQRFGIVEGSILWYKFRYGKTEKLKLKELQHPIFMTPNSIDNASFDEIFMDVEYGIEYAEYMSSAEITILDAGANIGFAAVFFANKFPKATIISIEPDGENFEKLVKNTEKYPQIKPIKGAIWNEETMIELKDEGWGTRGYIIDKSHESTETPNSIKAYTISGLMEELNIDQIDILKLDVEGSEKEIFTSNYNNWLPKTNCLIVELHDRMKPGCSDAVFNAISHYEFKSSENGENVVFINNNFSKS